jgi:hypothetical protein
MARWIILPDPLISRAKELIGEKTAGDRVSESFTEAAKAISKMGDAIAETTGQTIIRALISIDRLLPGLNGNDGLIRQSHFKATKVKAALLELVRAGQHGTFGESRVKIICTRYYCGTAMDFDNASASFKYLVDAIVKAGIIYDDSPKTIEEWTVRQVSVKSRKLQKMEVEILLFK